MYSHYVPDGIEVIDTVRNQNFHYCKPQALHISDFLVNDDNYLGSGANQYFSDAAVDGQGNFWVVWSDYRNGDWDTYLARCDANGNQLGPNIRVNDDRGIFDQRHPAVSANSNGAIVVWFESTALFYGDVYCQRFDITGNKIGLNERVNSVAHSTWSDYSNSLVDVAVNNSGDFIVTWVDHRDIQVYGEDIYMQLFDETGVPVGSNVRVNDDNTLFSQFCPACAIDGSGKSIVVWQDERLGNANVKIYAQGFTETGQPINSNFLVYPLNGFMPQVCMVTLNTAVITWSGNGFIYAEKYDIYGNPIVGPVQVSETNTNNRHSNIATNNNGYITITWWGFDGLYLNLYSQRLNPDLTWIGNNVQINDVSISLNGDVIPGIAFSASTDHILYVWSDEREELVYDTYGSIYEFTNGAPVTGNFRINDDQGAIRQITSGGSAGGPSVNASCSDRHVVVWNDMRDNFHYQIYGQLYDGSGNPIGSNFLISEAVFSAANPTVAMINNGDFVVAYQVGYQLYARRYNRDGVAYGPPFRVDDTPPTILNQCSFPAVDYDEEGKFVIVWEDYRNDQTGSDYSNIGLQCYDNNGIPVGANILLGLGPNANENAKLYNPGVAMNNSNKILICCMGPPSGGDFDIIGWHREYGQTSPQDEPFIINNITQNSQQIPAIASNGNDFLVVWLDDNDGDWHFDILGQRLSSEGVLLGANFNINERTSPDQYFEWPTLCTSLSGGYIVTWADNSEPDWNVYAQGVGGDGKLIGSHVRINNYDESFNYNHQINPGVSSNGNDIFFVWEDNRRHKSWDIYGNFIPRSSFWITDDPLSLAYNGNRHLVREPNSFNLHLVYTDQGNVLYRFSSDGGNNWSVSDIISNGAFPAICLDFQGNPCVTWTNTGNQLCFARKDPSQGWVTATYSFGTSQPTHPCIAITHQDITYTDSVHIIFRLFDNGFSSNTIREIAFPSTNPQNYNSLNIDNSLGLHMVTLDFPSTAIDYTYKLYATWMHGDTVYYGTRAPGQSRWSKYTNSFGSVGRNSAHPFVETYGDSIFVVWQNEMDGDVYRGSKYLLFPTFFTTNLSLTPTTPSIYPVNASGLVTTFVDKSLPLAEQDIFWKTYPGQPLHNISNTPLVKSIFPQTSLWISMTQAPQLYTVWQEGNTSCSVSATIGQIAFS
jgi:hypothetical protein